MNTIFPCVIVVSIAWVENPNAQEPTNVSDLLRNCSRTQSVMDHASLHVVIEATVEPDFHDSYQSKTEFSIHRDSDRLAAEGALHYFDQKRKDLSFRFRDVINKNERIGSSWRLDVKAPKGGSFTKENGGDEIERVCGVLDGYFLAVHAHGERAERITDRLLQKGANIRFRGEESVAGTLCKVVEGELPRLGRFTLWLAEDKGCLPLKINHESGPTDLNLASNRPLSELERPNPDKPEEMIALVGISETLDEVKIGKVDGEFVCISGRSTRVDKWSNGDLKRVSKITRSEINLRPSLDDATFAPRVLPEQAILGNDDNPSSGVLYVWRGGEVVPAYADFSGSAEGKWSARSVWLVVLWLVVGLAVLTISVRYIWRYKKAGG